MEYPPTQPEFDITVILNAHREGILAHRTFLSILRARSVAHAAGIRVEWLAILDDPDPETTAFFAARAEHFQGIYPCQFRDLGLSRNHGVKNARADLIAFIDADDLFSNHWLKDAFLFFKAQGRKNLILHPEFNLHFGAEEVFHHHPDQEDAEFVPGNLLKSNYWTALAFCPKQILLSVPYLPSTAGTGFGYEDWHWNCETMAQGYIHKRVPQSLHFIRRKENSLVDTHDRLKAVIRPTRLFDQLAYRPDLLTACDLADSDSRGVTVSGWQRLFKMSTGNLKQAAAYWAIAIHYSTTRLLLKLLPRSLRLSLQAFFANLTQSGRAVPVPPDPLPDWVLNEIRDAREIEPELPVELTHAWRKRKDYFVKFSPLGALYPLLSEHFGSGIKNVFLTSALTNRTKEALSRVLPFPAESSLLILVDAIVLDESAQHLPPSTRVMNFGELTRRLSPEDKALALLRLLLQKCPQFICNLDSALGWNLFKTYGQALKDQSKLFGAVYLEEPDAKASNPVLRQTGLSIFKCRKNLTAVYALDPNSVDKICNLFGLERSLFLPPEKDS